MKRTNISGLDELYRRTNELVLKELTHGLNGFHYRHLRSISQAYTKSDDMFFDLIRAGLRDRRNKKNLIIK